MSGADRRHAVGVARRVERALGHEATRPVMAAALLHDVGKVESRLGTYGRVVATLSAKVAGAETAHAWRRGSGFTRRVGLYLVHDQLGADLLAMAGSDPLTVAWAASTTAPRPTGPCPSTSAGHSRTPTMIESGSISQGRRPQASAARR
jgi:hypothetical protein